MDADAQGNLTQMLGWPQPDELSPTLADLMGKIITDQPVSPGEGILHHDSGVDLLPANIELSALEVTLRNDKLERFFPKSYTPKQMEDVILKLLEGWQRKRQQEQAR